MKLAMVGVTGIAVLFAAGQAVPADGKEVYNKSCALCHNAMPPKLGDKAAWEPRVKQGVDSMVGWVIKGKGAMPPRAGNAALSDNDIKAAVEYMISQAK